MKTSNQPRDIKQSLEWIASLNGQTRLCLLIDTDTNSQTYGKCLKAGKLATLDEFRSQSSHSNKAMLKSMTYYQAQTWMNEHDKYMPVDRRNDDYKPVEVHPMNQPDYQQPQQPTEYRRPTKQNEEVTTMGSLGVLDTIIDGKIETKVKSEVAEAVKGINIGPLPTIISTQAGPDAPVIEVGIVHKNFAKLLKLCNARGNDGHRLNILIHGPAGTSKSTSAKQVAKALNLPFYPCSAISDEYKLFGFRTATGEVVRTAFREVWEHGGVFLFDELSGSDENAFLSFNGTLANGIAPFPDGAIERHPDCIIIAGDNVISGATADYNGRNKMDEASLDRFVTLEWPIDMVLERAITANDDWTTLVQSARQAVESMGIKVLITPRASINGAALLRAGMTKLEAAEATMRKAMTDDQWSRLCSRIGLK